MRAGSLKPGGSVAGAALELSTWQPLKWIVGPPPRWGSRLGSRRSVPPTRSAAQVFALFTRCCGIGRPWMHEWPARGARAATQQREIHRVAPISLPAHSSEPDPSAGGRQKRRDVVGG